MFYDAVKNDHGLPCNPFKACISPRPLGWISTVNKQGQVNLAPYSFFNAVSDEPPQVMIGSNGIKAEENGRDKDTLTNIEDTREFVCNMAVWDLRQEMVNTSAPLKHGEAESGYVDVEMVPSEMIAPPRVKASPIHLECKLWKVIDLPADSNSVRNAMIVGQVVGIHISDDVLVDGFIDLAKVKPLARLGYLDYSVVDEIFQMRRPPGGD